MFSQSIALYLLRYTTFICGYFLRPAAVYYCNLLLQALKSSCARALESHPTVADNEHRLLVAMARGIEKYLFPLPFQFKLDFVVRVLI